MKYKYILFVILCLMFLSGCSNESNKKIKNQDTKDEKNAEVVLKDDQLSRIEEIIKYLPDNSNLYDEKLIIKDLPNSYKIEMFLKIDKSKDYTKKKINDWLSEYFGENGMTEMEDIICPYDNQVLLAYNEQTERLESTSHLGHGAWSVYVYRKILSTKKEDNKYYVEVIKAFSESIQIHTGDFTTLYKTAFDGITRSTPVLDNLGETDYCTLDNNGDENCNFDAIFEDNQDKFNTYIYTFIEKDGKLYFDSYELKNK